MPSLPAPFISPYTHTLHPYSTDMKCSCCEGIRVAFNSCYNSLCFKIARVKQNRTTQAATLRQQRNEYEQLDTVSPDEPFAPMLTNEHVMEMETADATIGTQGSTYSPAPSQSTSAPPPDRQRRHHQSRLLAAIERNTSASTNDTTSQ